MRTAFLTLGSVLLAAALIGTAIIFFGLFNVSARGGHWPAISWVLHTSYRQSVALRAPAANTVPELDDEDMVALGARHYQLSCAACHGEPGGRQLRTMTAMLPAPPRIEEAVSEWEPNELFWIIKHGVKMTGMPHWPARDRDDDIWPVVAFVSRIPRFETGQYRSLLSLENQPPASASPSLQASDNHPAVIHDCVLCHGQSGYTDNDHVPRLDILSREYLSATLKAYRDQQRSSGIMQQAASLLDDDTIEVLAAFYASSQTAPRGANISDRDPNGTLTMEEDTTAASVERGRRLATGGAASTTADSMPPSGADVPACNACHGPWPEPLSPHYPALASQSRQYLLAQLQLWKSGTRGGTPMAKLMHETVPELDYQQMADLSAYYSTLSGTDLTDRSLEN